MYSNLSLYYLEQLGIKPWIKRDEGQLEKKKQLVVLLDDSLSSKARFLLDKILDFISLDKHDKPLILTEKADAATLKRCNRYDALVVLNFRKAHSVNIIEELKGQSSPRLSLIDMSSPDDLLSHPVDKKKVFQQLLKVKDLISA